MFKFLSGVATGWIAARALPPKPPDVSPMSLPSVSEIAILTEQMQKMLTDFQEKMTKNPKISAPK